jgi:polysaccharide export outer membrane protein
MNTTTLLSWIVALLISASTFTQDIDENTTHGDSSGNSKIYPSDSFIPTFNWDPQISYDNYILGPGDVLNFHLFGGASMNLKLYVAADFTVFIPTVGGVSVRGLTLGAFRRLVNLRIKKFYKNTLPYIALYSPRTFFVHVLGVVSKPGQYKASALTRIHDFFNANKFLIEKSSKSEIEIRNSILKKSVKVDYQKYLLDGDLSANPTLQEGDQIILHQVKNSAWLYGDLVRSGKFEFSEENFLLEKAVDAFGGFINSNHFEGRITINRVDNGKPTSEYVEAENFFNKQEKHNFYNFKLKDGDRIYFPASSATYPTISDVIFLSGQVRNPGPKPFQPGMPTNFYISQAGGLSDRANFDDAVVYKISGESNPLGAGFPLQAGDTIFVPEKTFKFWQDHLLILTTFLTVVTTTIAITR